MEFPPSLRDSALEGRSRDESPDLGRFNALEYGRKGMSRVAAWFVAFVVLMGIGSYGAHADPAHEHGVSAGTQAGQAPHDGAHDDHMSESADLPEAWAALGATRDAISAALESGALSDIHAKTEPLPATAERLLELSPGLPADKRARVAGAVKQVARVAAALHEAADKGDAARTRSELGRLEGLLQLIAAQYPAGALDSMSHHDHGAQRGAAESGQSAGAHSHSHAERPAGAVDAAPQATIHVRALDPFRFEPTSLTVEAGIPTRIELENAGAAEHSLVVKTPDGKQDWVHLHALGGTTVSDTFRLDQPGTYSVLCTLPGHTEGGMVGRLVVAARKGAESQPHH